MKKSYLLLVFLFASFCISSQTVFWHEDFGSGCNQGMSASGAVATPSNNAWSVTSLTAGPGNGTQSNEWFISSAEAGFSPGTCGSGCIANATFTNGTLHVGTNLAAPALDAEAKYTITPNSNTNKMVSSSTVDCSNWKNIIVSFNYLAGGSGSDYAELQYFDGTSWSALMPLANTVWTCSPKAMWTSQSISLPSSANGNPDVKIGFRWQNNSGSGSDSASIAIDDIVLAGTSNVGIRELKWSPLSIKVFPNPASEMLYVEGLSGGGEIEISGVTGEIVHSEKVQGGKSSMDISALKSGIYFVKMRQNDYSASARFVKE